MTTFTTQDREEALKAIEGDDEIQAAATQEPRSFWNHRVIRMPDDGLGEEWLEIQEVYYNLKGEPCGYCNPCIGSETLDGVALQVQRFAECLKLPILNATTDFNNQWGDEYEKEY